MRTLMSICNDPWTLSKFGRDTATIDAFLEEVGLDGLELILWGEDDDAILPPSKLIGRHLRFWPVWLDFWRGNRHELGRQFGAESTWQAYYAAATPEEFVQNHRRELMDAQAMGADYAVFHVSHVQLEHVCNYRFTYTDSEIVEASVELLNRILDGLDIHLAILLENHWYPGLTYLDRGLAERLMQGVRYSNKGLLLDIGHLMNTNIDLDSEEGAVEYLLSVLGDLGDSRKHIRAVHLNSSLTGAYVKVAKEADEYRADACFEDRLSAAFRHVGTIDRHAPFLHPSIQRVIELVNPEYLVYEFAAETLEELKAEVTAQHAVL